MKNIKKSEINIILKDADPQSIQGEINVDKTKNEFEIHVKGKFLIKEPKLMESKMSKEEMKQFSLIIKEAIEESNKSLTQEIVSIKDELKFINTRLDRIDTRLTNIEKDIETMKNTPTMKKELGL